MSTPSMNAANFTSSVAGTGPATAPLTLFLQRMTMRSDRRPAEKPDRLSRNGHRQIGSAREPSAGAMKDSLPGLRFDGPTGNGGPAKRVAFYSHDTMGLGHLRRNLILAQSLAESPLGATSLLIAGAHEANFFALPPRVGLLTLPRLAKDGAGNYASGHLDLSVERLVKLRADSIRSALDAFAPDLVVVDKVPVGAFGEMLPALRRLRKRFGTKCVLGIRDVLDEPQQVRREWANAATQRALVRLYDEIWVYGDRRVYDAAREYDWPAELAAKVRFTGYLDQSQRVAPSRPIDGNRRKPRSASDRLIVCSLGGGQDGFELAGAFIDALPRDGHHGVLIAGPYMPAEQVEQLRRRSLSRPNLQFIRFTPESDRLVQLADKVVTMGGYNSVCSVLSFGKPALVAPRVTPRLEQWIRAERLAALGLVDVIHPDDLTPAALAAWIVADVAAERPAAAATIAMDGLASVGRYAAELVGVHQGCLPFIATSHSQQSP